MRRRRDESGAVAIIVALMLTGILVIVALVLDFGLIRVDRQVDKSAADSATLAGLHALNGGDANPRPFVGVCTAINYLQQNNDRFSAMAPNSGTWEDGTGTAWPTSDPCDDQDYLDKTCAGESSWARFAWAGTQDGQPLHVVIQSGYLLATDSGYSEDSLPAAEAENDDSADGCNQLAVLINQTREPGLGSLATSSDLKSSIRSVGRVKSITGGYAPALLLLRQTGCPVLKTGSSSGSSHIYVLGAITSDGQTQPGTIHSDSDGHNCTGGSNQNIYLGRAPNGIVAFAAPLDNLTNAADPDKPGQITAFGASEFSGGVLRDSLSNVCGSTLFATTLLIPAGACAASPVDVQPNGLVTRSPVDARYRGAVRGIVQTAQTNVFGLLTSANAVSNGYVKVTCTGGGVVGSLPTLTPSSKLFVDCSNTKSIPTINAGTVVFNGVVSPSATISMPNATAVYVFGSSGNGIDVGTGTFSMHTSSPTGSSNLSSAKCSPSTTASNNRAILVIKNGQIKQGNGGLMQLCYTTMVMMGGQANGCLFPPSNAAAPNPTPCGGAAGTGIISETGGGTDWTAPNQYDLMLLPNGDPDPAKSGGWTNEAGPEDLAFWSESYGTASAWNLNGTGTMNTVGVYMAPNADPFKIGGGSSQTLSNAQYIASSIELNGSNTSITMKVDPNSAITLPRLEIIGLVR